jgi:hypothetical protein
MMFKRQILKPFAVLFDSISRPFSDRSRFVHDSSPREVRIGLSVTNARRIPRIVSHSGADRPFFIESARRIMGRDEDSLGLSVTGSHRTFIRKNKGDLRPISDPPSRSDVLVPRNVSFGLSVTLVPAYRGPHPGLSVASHSVYQCPAYRPISPTANCKLLKTLAFSPQSFPVTRARDLNLDLTINVLPALSASTGGSAP